MNTLFNRWLNCCPPRAKQVPPSHVGSDPTALLPAVPHAAHDTPPTAMTSPSPTTTLACACADADRPSPSLFDDSASAATPAVGTTISEQSVATYDKLEGLQPSLAPLNLHDDINNTVLRGLAEHQRRPMALHCIAASYNICDSTV
jgi:hypothetical protein